MPMEITEIRSLRNLITVVNDWELCNPERGAVTHWIWYRGQPVENDVVPGAERPDFVARAKEYQAHKNPFYLEQIINAEFRRSGASFFTDDTDLVRIYLLAQHYGLPTRLLDWTTNPLAALFFAVCEKDNDNGKLFVAKSNRFSESSPRFPTNERNKEVITTVEFLFQGGKKPDNPGIIPLHPALRFLRMMRQGSCFTLHMPDAQPLKFIEGGKPDGFQFPRSYLIPKGSCKKDLRDELRRMGVTWAALFSELDYVTKEIRASFNL